MVSQLSSSPSPYAQQIHFTMLCPADRRIVLCGLVLDPPGVFRLVVDEQVVRLGLRGRFRIRLVQQVLDARQDLLHGDGRPPPLLLVQDGEADRSARINVGMEQGRDEFACAIKIRRKTTHSEETTGWDTSASVRSQQ